MKRARLGFKWLLTSFDEQREALGAVAGLNSATRLADLYVRIYIYICVCFVYIYIYVLRMS